MYKIKSNLKQLYNDKIKYNKDTHKIREIQWADILKRWVTY